MKNDIMINALKREVEKQLDQCILFGENEDYSRRLNVYFCKTLIENFDEIFKTPITHETYDPNEIKVAYTEEGKWKYNMLIFGKIHHFCCDRFEKLDNLLIENAVEEEALFSYNLVYILGFVKDECRMQKHQTREIKYQEPHLECEEGLPLFDTDDCPVCMEKFETTEPTCIKINTYCGHPLCLDCYENICKSNNVCCPICREDYTETSNNSNDEYYLNDETIKEMIDSRDDMLYDMIDIPGLIQQSIIADGYGNLLRCTGFITENDDYFFGKKEDL